MSTRDKPGKGLRALAVFIVLNVPIAAVVVFAFYMAGGLQADWPIRAFLVVALAVSEFALVTTTIAPPMLEWINSTEEYEKPPLVINEQAFMKK